MLNINDYQKEIEKFMNPDTVATTETRLVNGCMGCVGEAAEVLEHLKKFLFHGQDLDRAKMIKELGDCAFYLCETASALEVSMSEVLQTNVDKLNARYKEGFTVEESKAKNDEV